ncbi:MAG: DUF2007 domain-containing protein [bacterium]|jgi:hypothetical protein
MALLTEYILSSEDFSKPRGRDYGIENPRLVLFGPAPDRAVRLTVLESPESLVEAEIRAGWLGANEITCFVTNNTSWIVGAMPVSELMRPRILVPEDRLEEARELLEVLEAGGNLSLAEAEYLNEE